MPFGAPGVRIIIKLFIQHVRGNYLSSNASLPRSWGWPNADNALLQLVFSFILTIKVLRVIACLSFGVGKVSYRISSLRKGVSSTRSIETNFFVIYVGSTSRRCGVEDRKLITFMELHMSAVPY